MTEQGMRFRIGIFVLAALILLAVLITLFGGAPVLFKRHDTLHSCDSRTRPASARARRCAAPACASARCRSVDLDDETGKVKVVVAIDKQHTIYHDEQPTLMQSLLGGDTTIDFVQQPRRAQLENGEPVPRAYARRTGRGVGGRTASRTSAPWSARPRRWCPPRRRRSTRSASRSRHWTACRRSWRKRCGSTATWARPRAR